jgi:hypothetical protein
LGELVEKTGLGFVVDQIGEFARIAHALLEPAPQGDVVGQRALFAPYPPRPIGIVPKVRRARLSGQLRLPDFQSRQVKDAPEGPAAAGPAR